MSGPPAAGGPGTLYCVPTPITSDRGPQDDLAPAAVALVARLDYVVAESAKTARAVLKRFPLERPIQSIEIVELSEHTRDDAIAPMLEPLLAGRSAALASVGLEEARGEHGKAWAFGTGICWDVRLLFVIVFPALLISKCQHPRRPSG